jgi:hypothetical protein
MNDNDADLWSDGETEFDPDEGNYSSGFDSSLIVSASLDGLYPPILLINLVMARLSLIRDALSVPSSK